MSSELLQERKLRTTLETHFAEDLTSKKQVISEEVGLYLDVCCSFPIKGEIQNKKLLHMTVKWGCFDQQNIVFQAPKRCMQYSRNRNKTCCYQLVSCVLPIMSLPLP